MASSRTEVGFGFVGTNVDPGLINPCLLIWGCSPDAEHCIARRDLTTELKSAADSHEIENTSGTKHGVNIGLHFQCPPTEKKLTFN